MGMEKAALFDLDGVLIDTEGVYTDFWASIGREYGCKTSFANDIKGTTLTNILMTYFPDLTIREEITSKIHDFEEKMQYRVFDGVLDFLTSLKKAEFKIAIVTSSDNTKMSFLELQQSNLISLFDVVVTGSMVAKSKPDPEGYILAAKLLDIDISKCFVFEDSIQGVEAGARSGATVIGVATTNSRDKLHPYADAVIDNFVDGKVYDIVGIEN